MTYISDRITVDGGLCNGRPTIRCMGITLRTILEYVFAGDTYEDFLYQNPDLETEDIEACVQFALASADRQHTIRQFAA